MVNPLLAGGPAGVAYFGNSWISDSGAVGVSAHRSEDGVSWSPGVDPAGTQAQNLAVLTDPTDPSRLYAAWTRHEKILDNLPPAGTSVQAASSSDGGQSFSGPVTLYAPPPDQLAINIRLHRGSDGSLLALFDQLPKSALSQVVLSPAGPVQLKSFASRSTDGGEHWSPPVDAGAPVFFGFSHPDSPGRTYLSAKFDTATGPAGQAAVAWAEPVANGQGTIRIARSTDGGNSWSEPFTAIAVAANVIQPALAIGRDGTLGLFWYDARSDTAGDGKLDADAWFASSDDAGKTWRSIHLAGPFDLHASFDPDVPFHDGGQAIGINQDLTAMHAGGFGAAYTIGVPLAAEGVTDVEFAAIRPR